MSAHRGIAISGKAGAGKSTLVQAVRRLLDKNGYNPTVISFAEPVKSLSKAVLVNLNLVEQTAAEEEWKYKYRGVPQIVGLHLRSYNENVWVELAMARIKGFPAGTIVLNDDCRFPNEAQALRENGVFLVRIETSRELRVKRLKELKNETHISETALDQWAAWDLVIHQDHEHDVALPDVYARLILKQAGFTIAGEAHQKPLEVEEKDVE